MTEAEGYVTLAECPIGLFWSAIGELCLKTEYGSNEGRIDAYIVRTGEFFWGSQPQTIANQREQMVEPFEVPLSALAALAEKRWQAVPKEATAAMVYTIPATDEFAMGIWWRPDGLTSWRNATGAECAAEIQRLRAELVEHRKKWDAGHALYWDVAAPESSFTDPSDRLDNYSMGEIVELQEGRAFCSRFYVEMWTVEGDREVRDFDSADEAEQWVMQRKREIADREARLVAEAVPPDGATPAIEAGDGG